MCGITTGNIIPSVASFIIEHLFLMICPFLAPPLGGGLPFYFLFIYIYSLWKEKSMTSRQTSRHESLLSNTKIPFFINKKRRVWLVSTTILLPCIQKKLMPLHSPDPNCFLFFFSCLFFFHACLATADPQWPASGCCFTLRLVRISPQFGGAWHESVRTALVQRE